MFNVVEFLPQNTGRSYHRQHHHYYQYQYYYYFIFFNFYIVCYRHTACLNISAELYLTTQTESSLGQYKLEVRACLHGVGDPGLVGLVSFVFTLWGTQNKRNLPHYTGVPHSM